LDLGDDWIPELQKVLDKFSVPRDFVEYVEGSTTELPFPDDSFDFVISNGVVMHLETVQLAEKALEELTRVTAPEGRLYVYTGVDKPGIVDRYILPALRQAYAEDEEFRNLVDSIDPVDGLRQLRECYSTGAEYDKEISEEFISYLGKLFTLDSATFTQNALQAPVQQGPKLTEAWARGHLARLGLKNIRRVKERYWMRNDDRRFLAPIHYRLDLPIPRILYGNGHVKIIAEK
jgi:SAM-dependent methyltransferase